MKKKLLLLLPFLFLAFSLQVSALTCNWGYCNSVVNDQFGSVKTGKAAIYIPAEVAKMYEGKQITHVRVGLAAKAKTVKAFITKDLNGEYLAQRTQRDQLKGFNEIKFAEPWTIDGEGFYIGYEFEADDYAIGASSMYNENGCWADLGDGWKNYAADEHALALTIQAKIKGDELPNDFWIFSSNDILAEAGKAFDIRFTIRNMSSIIGRRFSVAYSIDGGEEQTLQIKQTVGQDLEKELSFQHPGFPNLGRHTVTIRLLGVNGEPDAYEGNNTVTSTIRIMNTLPVQRMVVEEGTGTWCQYCTRGIEGMNYMTEKYPDTFIGIAVHKSDEFAISSYNDLSFSSYPSSYVMRDLSEVVNPSSGNLENAYNYVVAQQPVAAVGLVAGYTDDSRTKISARTNLNFFSAKDGLNYRLSFVLLESGMMAYQAGYYKDTEMNHVARMNYAFSGFANSVPKSVAEDEDVESFTELDMPSNVVNKDNTELVVLLIDGVSGQIANAAKCHIAAEPPVTGISEKHAVAVPAFTVRNGQLDLNGYSGTVQVYDASGKQVSGNNMKPGLYILRGTDGKNSFATKLVVR